MPRMTTGGLRALLAAEKADALAAASASRLSAERTRALDYYLGDMAADMPAPDGRSRAVSSPANSRSSAGDGRDFETGLRWGDAAGVEDVGVPRATIVGRGAVPATSARAASASRPLD